MTYLINHPGLIRTLQYINYYYVAATPPLKGGETYSVLSFNNITLRLTAMSPGEFGDCCVGGTKL